jgi:hypothetical protein
VADTEWAAHLAAGLLRPLGDRWEHTLGVVRRAQELAPAFDPDDLAVLVAVAYLQDIGYARELAATGFHALDGARHLRTPDRDRLAGLVTHHSAARFEAKARDLTNALAEFQDEASPISAVLTWCDMTTRPGRRAPDPR